MTGLTSGMALVGGASQGTGRVVAAGGAETAMTEALTAGQREKLLASGSADHVRTPDDVAAGVAYSASEGAGYATGPVLD